jgi:hypothetical protein
LVRAKELDRINGNTLWIDALKLEMHNVGVAFEVREDGKGAPQGWTKASRSAIKNDGTYVHEYVLLYADDALSVVVEAESILRKEIGKYFELKEKSIGPPKLYLGGHLNLVELDNGVKAWAFSSSQYVRAAVQNVTVRGGSFHIRLKPPCAPPTDQSLMSHPN